MLKIIEGDLLKIEEGTLVHQVNCFGATGGLAGALRRKWPNHFNAYFEDIAVNKQTDYPPSRLLGDFSVGCEGDERICIVHIFGQLQPGPNTDLEAVDVALSKYAKWRSEGKDTGLIYAPFLMGCGLGGGDWVKYSSIIEKHLPDCIIVRKY